MHGFHMHVKLCSLYPVLTILADVVNIFSSSITTMAITSDQSGASDGVANGNEVYVEIKELPIHRWLD